LVQDLIDAKDLLINLLQKDPNDRLEAADILNHPWIIQMTSFSNIENENNNNNNNISEQQQQKVILANDNQIDTTTTSSPNNEDTVNKQLLSDVNKQLTSSAANPVVHFDISSSPSSPNNDDDENVPMSPTSTTIFTNNLRKAMSTHLWSPTMSQNRPAVRAANKMRRQSSVVEFYLQHEDSYLSRCEY